MKTRPFTCVAVANRGEAAVRFMRAAHAWARPPAGIELEA